MRKYLGLGFLLGLTGCLVVSCAPTPPSLITPHPKIIVIYKEPPVSKIKKDFEEAVDDCRHYGWSLEGCEPIFQSLQNHGDKDKAQDKIKKVAKKLKPN